MLFFPCLQPESKENDPDSENVACEVNQQMRSGKGLVVDSPAKQSVKETKHHGHGNHGAHRIVVGAALSENGAMSQADDKQQQQTGDEKVNKEGPNQKQPLPWPVGSQLQGVIPCKEIGEGYRKNAFAALKVFHFLRSKVVHGSPYVGRTMDQARSEGFLCLCGAKIDIFRRLSSVY